MIGYLRGEILENSEGHLILGVGQGASIGYSVTVPDAPAYLDFVAGKKAEFFIHTHVREDALDLYGFATRGEKELFLTLLTVNGIGPKGALGILSKVDPATLIQAVSQNDKDGLTRIPGIGKKTAERLVVELGDTLTKKLEAGAFGAVALHATSAKPARGSAKTAPSGASFHDPVMNDAKDALISLGYREADIVALLNRVNESGAKPVKAEELIRLALQRMS